MSWLSSLQTQLSLSDGDRTKLLTSALDFFSDSTTAVGSETGSCTASCLGKRKREGSNPSESGSNPSESGSDVEGANTGGGEDTSEGVCESGGGVAMELIAGHTPMKSRKRKEAPGNRKKKKLSKETKQLLRRQEVLSVGMPVESVFI